MRLLALLPALLAVPAGAEPWACNFTVSCVAGLDCSDHDLSAHVIAADHEGQLFLDLGGLPILASPLAGQEGAAYAARDAETAALLSIGPDGTAWLSLHQTTATTLFGHCEPQ